MRLSIWNGSYITYADDTNLYWESAVDAINETIKQWLTQLHQTLAIIVLTTVCD